jgi:uncharacterized protein YqgQ
MTYFELIQHIRTYRGYIYTGDKEADLDLLEEEVQELYRLGLVDARFYRDAKLVIIKERSRGKEH